MRVGHIRCQRRFHFQTNTKRAGKGVGCINKSDHRAVTLNLDYPILIGAAAQIHDCESLSILR